MKKPQKEPERTFVFRVTPEGMPRVARTLEISEKQSLHHLHLAIQHAFSLRGKNLYAFYLSGRHWDPESEYGGPQAGSPRKAKKALLGKLAINRSRPFLYLLNFEKENWFEVEWMEERRAEPGRSYPLLLEAEGELPLPAPPLEDALPPSLKSLVQGLKPVLFSYDPSVSKPRTPKEVQEAKTLVESIYKVMQEKGEDRWPLLEEATGMLLADWLLSLPQDFFKRGYTEEAVQLCDFFAQRCEPLYFQCEKALLLTQMGKRKSALEIIQEASSRSPDDPRMVAKAAEVFWKMEEIGPAERLFRRALDLAMDDLYERELILTKFVAMLEENERQEEAIELIRAELDRG
ncbi:MAG: hypothetical protein AB1640_01635 [bacterium]